MIKLDLGAGRHPKEGFIPVDRADLELPDQVVWDLVDGKPWPWETSTVDELHSSHFIEHIPANEIVRYCWAEWKGPGQVSWEPDGKPIDALFFFFDEAWRIAKPNATFELIWPALKSTNAFRDPTHRRFLPLEFLHYMSKRGREVMRVEHYGAVCDWNVEKSELLLQTPLSVRHRTDEELVSLWEVGDSYHVLLRAVKT